MSGAQRTPGLNAIDAEAETWLLRLYPDSVANDGMTHWESVRDDVKDVLRGFVVGRRSAGLS